MPKLLQTCPLRRATDGDNRQWFPATDLASLAEWQCNGWLHCQAGGNSAKFKLAGFFLLNSVYCKFCSLESSSCMFDFAHLRREFSVLLSGILHEKRWNGDLAYLHVVVRQEGKLILNFRVSLGRFATCKGREGTAHSGRREDEKPMPSVLKNPLVTRCITNVAQTPSFEDHPPAVDAEERSELHRFFEIYRVVHVVVDYIWWTKELLFPPRYRFRILKCNSKLYVSLIYSVNTWTTL